MSSCSVQFHALNEELFAFIEELRADHELFIFCSDDLRLREYSIITVSYTHLCRILLRSRSRIRYL